jgi:hypothetical protein
MKVDANFWSRKKPKHGERVVLILCVNRVCFVGYYDKERDRFIAEGDFAYIITNASVPVWISLASIHA